MVVMLGSSVRVMVLCASVLAGLPWVRQASVAPTEKAAKAETPAAAAPDRVVLLTADDPEYTALAIPNSYKTAPSARLHLLVFRGGLCVRDHGLADTLTKDGRGVEGAAIVEQAGTNQRAFVAPDGRVAIVVGTRYVSRVDVTPGQTSTANDTVKGDTTLTWVDPTHPDGRWRVTLENARWVKDLVVLANDSGVVVTTFLPRNGPNDVRILDATGHESIRVPESYAEVGRIEGSPDGAFAAAEVTFRENPRLPERGVIVFDVARKSQWTYGWRYGSDDEPVSWTLESRGVLDVRIPGDTRRFDATGRRL
jgi:hypothetical protein